MSGSGSRSGSSLGHDDDQRAVDVPAERGGVPATALGRPGPAGQDVAQEVGPVLALDRRDRLGLGDRQRGDRRRPLQQVHVVVGRARGRRRRRRAGRGRARRPRSGRRRGAAPALAGGREPDRLGLDDEPARPSKQPRSCDLPRASGAGQHAAVGGGHHDRRRRRMPASSLAQAVQPAAVEHDLDQRAVRLLRAGERGGLPVEHLGEHLVEDVVEARRPRAARSPGSRAGRPPRASPAGRSAR